MLQGEFLKDLKLPLQKLSDQGYRMKTKYFMTFSFFFTLPAQPQGTVSYSFLLSLS